MNFKKVNNITGWVICIIACLVYILTAEASGSFWDTGEFIASAYKLQLPHPPGAPVFTLLGRMFIVLFGGNNPAFAVNVMSAVASGFTILFLFWTITHFGRKLMVGFFDEPTPGQTYTIMGAGIVGALAYTFSDSFWFSAVEGEVYALSSFFTALVFWAMLKWERADVEAGTDPILKRRADRWIIFIFFMMGLSIGVHLLNLLTIPAIVMIYYYKRYNYTRNGAIWAFLIGCVITGIVQVAAIQWTVKVAGKFDIWFVNGFGLPFFSGFIFFFILLAILVWFGLRYARQRGYSFLQLGLWCFVFMMIGYSTYVTSLVRSNANPSIDMNNVDNPMSLVYYLGREQYGSAPLVFGPHFQAEYDRDETGQVRLKEGEMKYTKGEEAYVPLGKEQEPEYRSEDKMLFPRIWDRSNDQGHADFYADWLDLQRMQNPQTGEQTFEAPTYGDNINWFITYQMGFMYWRYFMWNFAGKQNDIQGFGNKRDGNWLSGIPFVDDARLGDQSKMPESLKENKANNKLFFLPFILGILGCVYHFLKDRKDWIVCFLLFFFTGLAIVLYLNQPGNQPRERDYAYVGSFYAFAIWIGLAVIALVGMARERADKFTWNSTLLYGAIGTFIIGLLSNTTTTFGGAMISSILMTLLYGAVAALLGFIVRAASGKGDNLRMATITAFALCMIAPVVMASQEWNDHDRSKKTLAPAMARNYLESCAPNAILFTFGDNDTYPLWYAQEVEGVRPDIRIINTSLLGIDWYVNQLRYKVNQSDPIDVVWSPKQISGLAYIMYRPQGPQDRAYPLADVMKNVIGPMLNTEDKTNVQATFPVRKFTVPADPAALSQYGVTNPTDTVLTEFQFEIPEYKTYLTLDQLTIMNIIAANGWKRPIYFTSPYGELGFGQFLRKDGLTYRLVPVRNSFPQQNWVVDQALRGTSIRDNNSDVMYKNLMTKFTSGGANIFGVYFDEENRRHLLSVRSVFAEAAGNLADKGRKPESIKLLTQSESLIIPQNLPYAMASRYNSHNQTSMLYLEAAYKAGHTELANKLKTAIRKDLTDQKAYYDYLKNEREEFFDPREAEINEFMLQLLEMVEKNYTQSSAPVQENPRRAADTTTAQ
jgi:MFS family permease